MNFIVRFFKRLIWIKNGKPTVTLPGCNCGCCGKWIEKKIYIADYNRKTSLILNKGEEWPNEYWQYSWGLCDNCGKEDI